MTEANISGLPRHADIHTGPQTTECAARADALRRIDFIGKKQPFYLALVYL